MEYERIDIGKKVRFEVFKRDGFKCLQILKNAYAGGVEIGELIAMAKESKTWSGWQTAIYHAMKDAENA